MNDQYHNSEAGFSLLETLFALMIMSIASLALFQSTSAMLSLSDRAVKAGERVLDRALDQRAVDIILSSLVPHWPEQDAGAFTGDARSMRGLSAGALTLGRDVTPFELSLINADGRAAAVRGSSQVLQYHTLSDARRAEDTDTAALMANLPADANFTYMGIDAQWSDKWPPSQTPVTKTFNDALFIRPPLLPEAIRLQSGDVVIFSVVVERFKYRPVRLELGRDAP